MGKPQLCVGSLEDCDCHRGCESEGFNCYVKPSQRLADSVLVFRIDLVRLDFKTLIN